MTQTTPKNLERRLNRSHDARSAMTYQLEHVQALAGMRAFVLSDKRGLVLAQAGPRPEASVLAAYAPVLAGAEDAQTKDHLYEEIHAALPHAGRGNIHVRSFVLDGETVYLCAVVQPSPAGEAGMFRAKTGIRRIFNEVFEAA